VSRDRIVRVRVALVGFEVGDRVVVFRDTKSTLGNMLLLHPMGLPGLVVSPVPSLVYEDRHAVDIDPGYGWSGRWWVHPDDMRLE
jgi:hypothetical protein